ncbi:MAG: DUF3368 domain-containing protein [Salinivirgaceae bacterium]|jgi:predicted nucleic acid-binding protein|nr:DUF3368 domain-containing protein [Salinivirgaceae bacterium]
MRNGLVIADSGPIISLVLADKLWILDELFDEIKIPKAVWTEITADESKPFISKIKEYFSKKVQEIKGFNELTFVMDYGESESVILYRETNASFLLIDDKKARKIAENFGIQCIGTIGLLSISKDKRIINELRPIFKTFNENKRFYSQKLLNLVLESKGEDLLN